MSEAALQQQLFQLLKRRWETCKACPLSDSRHNVVIGEGPLDKGVMVIGDAPGFREDIWGKLFFDGPGELLDVLIRLGGGKRGNLFMTNLVACRPPDDRAPAPPEIAACSRRLKQLVDIINPKAIVLLGELPLFHIAKKRGLAICRGKTFSDIGGRKIIPTWSPAQVLHINEWSTRYRREQEMIVHLSRASSFLESTS